jgi:hypothetical protein
VEAMLRERRRQVASPSLESSSRGSSWVTLSLDHGPSAAADDAPPNPPRKHQLWSVSHSCGRATASMDDDSDDSDSEKHFRRNKRATAKDKEDAMTSMPALEAYCKGSWWDASILKQRGEEFRVRYEKFKSADNEWLPQGHLRMRSRMAYPSDCKQVLSRGNDVCVFAHHPDGRNRHAVSVSLVPSPFSFCFCVCVLLFMLLGLWAGYLLWVQYSMSIECQTLLCNPKTLSLNPKTSSRRCLPFLLS